MNIPNGKAILTQINGVTTQQGILDCTNITLYYTEQTVWKLNIEEYTRRRNLLGGKYGLIETFK